MEMTSRRDRSRSKSHITRNVLASIWSLFIHHPSPSISCSTDFSFSRFSSLIIFQFTDIYRAFSNWNSFQDIPIPFSPLSLPHSHNHSRPSLHLISSVCLLIPPWPAHIWTRYNPIPWISFLDFPHPGTYFARHLTLTFQLWLLL